MPRPSQYEFSQRTKNTAISRWHWEHPGREDEKLEVHHIIPVRVAITLDIPPTLVRTADNAQAMPVAEHKEKHQNEPSLEEYRLLAQSILGWHGNLFTSTQNTTTQS